MARKYEGPKMNLIGGNLKRIRQERGFSQITISRALEYYGVIICRGSISRIEDYSRTVTDIELYAIAQVLNVDIGSLIENKK